MIAALYLATLNGHYDVSRSRTIDADPEVVFNDLNDFKNWQAWGPWYEEDSTIQVTYAEKTVGEGASYTWTSEIEGGGEMRTLKVDQSKRLDQEIVFKTPFGDMRSDIYWILDDIDSGTKLTWGIKGEMPFLSRFMASGMEEQMGPMEERGLELFDANLKKKLEIYSIDDLGIIDYSGGFYLYLTTASKMGEMEPKFRELMSQIEVYMKRNSIRVVGSPFTIYHKIDHENRTTMYSVAYPISERIITDKGTDILTGFMDRGRYYKIVLKGSYKNTSIAWEEAMAEVSSLNDYSINELGEPFEVYVNNPRNTPNPANLITEIFIPIQKR